VGIPQGDLKLLDSEIAKRLLNSKIPARLAYIAKDGTPRVIPTWFHWDGSDFVMAAFMGGPHVRREPARPAALRQNQTSPSQLTPRHSRLMCFSSEDKHR
jgi:hypothetical protein